MRPVYNFPETIFVERNTLGEQIEHVLSEMDEVVEALNAHDGLDEINEELGDLAHSIETLWRIIADYHGPEFLEDIFARVEAKNRARGYYTPTPPVAAQEQAR